MVQEIIGRDTVQRSRKKAKMGISGMVTGRELARRKRARRASFLARQERAKRTTFQKTRDGRRERSWSLGKDRYFFQWQFDALWLAVGPKGNYRRARMSSSSETTNFQLCINRSKSHFWVFSLVLGILFPFLSWNSQEKSFLERVRRRKQQVRVLLEDSELYSLLSLGNHDGYLFLFVILFCI